MNNLINILKQIGGTKTCPDCKGDGNGDAEDMGIPCGGCNGTGQIITDLAPLLTRPKELSEVVGRVRQSIIADKEISLAGLCGFCCKDLRGGVGFCSMSCQLMWSEHKIVKGYHYGESIPEGYGSYGYMLGERPPEKATVKIPLLTAWPICVVGPKRASNLVYEVARQLNGVAITMEADTVVARYERGLRTPAYEQAGAITRMHYEEDTKVLMELERQGAVEYKPSTHLPLVPDHRTSILLVTDKADESEAKTLMAAVLKNAKCGYDYLPYLLCLTSKYQTFDMTDVFMEHPDDPPGPYTCKIIAAHQEQ